MLIYPDQVQKWLHFGHGQLILLNLKQVKLNERGSSLQFPGIIRRAYERNDMKFGMLMYSGYIQDWKDVGWDMLVIRRFIASKRVS